MTPTPSCTPSSRPAAKTRHGSPTRYSPRTRSVSPPTTTKGGSPRCRPICARVSRGEVGPGAGRSVRRSQRQSRRRHRRRGHDLRQRRPRVQPPRGFGENPSRSTTTPTSRRRTTTSCLPLARGESGRRRVGFGADAVVHPGQTRQSGWLPGKTLGMSASCGTDAALGDLPLVYRSSSTTRARARRPGAVRTPSSSTT